MLLRMANIQSTAWDNTGGHVNWGGARMRRVVCHKDAELEDQGLQGARGDRRGGALRGIVRKEDLCA